MKTHPRRGNSFTGFWRTIFKRSSPAHDPLLSLSLIAFNFSTGWVCLLQKQQQGGA
ncbi:MAG: hypothetical protein WCE61_24215 [Candidatus Acidiferrum sp.]